MPMNGWACTLIFVALLKESGGSPGGSDGKESACSVGDPGSIPRSESSPEEGMAAHSGFLPGESPLLRGDWWATVHGVAKTWTQLSE